MQVNTSPFLTPEVVGAQKYSEIVVIGGGPVGFWTAIQIKILTGKNVTVIEKYGEYQRADIRLNIEASSLSGIPEDIGLKKLVAEWGDNRVPIKSMEESLEKRASELGIGIIKGYQVDPKTITEMFPTAKVVIGADGAKSITRKEIFEDKFRFNSTFQYVAQFQYRIKNNTNGFEPKSIKQSYVTQKFVKNLLTQTIRPFDENSSIVNLQVFIDKKTHDQMSDATFKNPYYFEKDLDKIPSDLRETITKWWGVRELRNQEEIIQDETYKNKCTILPLGSYASEEVVKIKNGVTYALVGDAAAAFPFFRAVNNGLLCGTKLAQSVADAFEEKMKHPGRSVPMHLNSYSKYTTWRVYVEHIKAYVKNLFLDLSTFWFQIADKAFWSPFKLSTTQRLQYHNQGKMIWERLNARPIVKQEDNYWAIFNNLLEPLRVRWQRQMG